jgi:hypothetical protein
MSGFADQTLKSGANGSTMALQAQEGNSILNAILENLEERESEVGQLVLMQLIANAEKVDLSSLSPEQQVLMQEVLQTPIEDVPVKFKFKVETTDAAKSENARKQNYLMIAQLYQMYGQSTLPLVQLAANPQVPPDMQLFADKLLLGSTELLSKIIEFSDIGNPSDFLPFLDDLKAKIAIADAQKQALAQQLEAQSAGSTGNMGSPSPGIGNVPGGLGGSVPGSQVASPGMGLAGPVGQQSGTPGFGNINSGFGGPVGPGIGGDMQNSQR